LRVHVPPPPPFWGYRKFFEGTVVHSKISVKGTIILVHGKWDMCYCLNHITLYNSLMSCFMLILTWGGIIFVDILHRAKARCKI
jgi:hypothetical protein